MHAVIHLLADITILGVIIYGAAAATFILPIIYYFLSAWRQSRWDIEMQAVVEKLKFTMPEGRDHGRVIGPLKSWIETFPFYEDAGVKILKGASGTNIFRKYHDIGDLVVGKVEDVDVRIFIQDYGQRYAKHGGKQPWPVSRTIICLRSETLILPKFAMRPRRMRHRFLKAIGVGNYIEFTDPPRFSPRYVLQGKKEKHIRRLFKADVLAYLLHLDKVSLEGAYHVLVFYRRRHKVRPRDIPAFLDQALGVYRLLKSK